MLQPSKNGKKRKERRRFLYNIFNINWLSTSLIFRVFATNFAVDCLHANYERHFVKEIQHLFLYNAPRYLFYISCFVGVCCGCKNSVF